MSQKSWSKISTICCLLSLVLLVGVAIAFGLFYRYYYLSTSQLLSISSFSPTSGAANSTVVIYGSGFNTTQVSYNTVKFNGVSASIYTANSSVLVVEVPSLATTGTISVKVSQTTFETIDLFTLVNGSSNSSSNSTSQ